MKCERNTGTRVGPSALNGGAKAIGDDNSSFMYSFKLGQNKVADRKSRPPKSVKNNAWNKKKTENIDYQWPAKIANVTKCGTFKPPGPELKMLTSIPFIATIL